MGGLLKEKNREKKSDFRERGVIQKLESERKKLL